MVGKRTVNRGSLKSIAPKKSDKINFIGYADDFVITGASKELLENKIKPQIINFLQERGLTLSEEKTLVTHINDGFDFLGFNLRKYKGKLLTKPCKNNVLLFVRHVRKIIKKHPTIAAGDLIRMLNPKLRGWANYYRHSVAKQTFSYVDCQLFRSLSRWANRRHPNKGKRWIASKYFLANSEGWQFQGTQKIFGINQPIYIEILGYLPIRRHVKIQGQATRYDPEFEDYFFRRKLKLTGRLETCK